MRLLVNHIEDKIYSNRNRIECQFQIVDSALRAALYKINKQIVNIFINVG
jgi:hypothetical protein